MLIMIDSNIVISAVLFPKSDVARALDMIVSEHDLVLSTYSLYEIRKVFNEKFPQKTGLLESFLQSTNYNIHETFNGNMEKYTSIVRDKSDIPIFMSFVESRADILVTGDSDFFTVELADYNILSIREFLDEYS